MIGNPTHYPLSELESLPTLSVGQAHDLKREEEVDGTPTRWWVSRCTAEDGEKWAVYIEQCIDGRWRDVDCYERL
jgi:hypothetical protein